MTPEWHVVALGNPFDGITLVGPFDGGKEANEWAERYNQGSEYLVVSLDEPLQQMLK